MEAREFACAGDSRASEAALDQAGKYFENRRLADDPE
jgi:hypothetical protein